MIVFIVDEIESDSFVEKWFFALVLGKEGWESLIVESGEGGGRLMVAEVIFESGVEWF